MFTAYTHLYAVAAKVDALRDEGNTWEEIAEYFGKSNDLDRGLYRMWRAAGFNRKNSPR